MRIVPCTIVLACLLVAVNGCQLFEKKNGGSGGGSDTTFLGTKNNDKPKATQSTDPLIGEASGGADLEGLLAGRVIDGTGQPADAQIRWVCIDDPKDAAQPIQQAVDSQGYFTIQGLKSGKHYRLITTAKSGDKTLEVETLTQAPNIHLLIHVNGRFVVPNAPDKNKINSDKGKKSAANPKEQPASAQTGQPWQQQQNPTMLPPVPTFGDPTKIAGVDVATKPPTIITPGPGAGTKGWPGSGAPVQIAPPESPLSIQPGPAPVPSCVKIGQRLENFALLDIGLQAWELKKERRGKLVLLDFWKTTCAPCLGTIPELRIMQNQYGSAGLQIVSIAYEDSGTLLEQAKHVTAVAQQRQTNYQLLLGGGAQCPLKGELRVRAFPTLVLIDETGLIVWEHEGALDALSKDDLKFAIERRLR